VTPRPQHSARVQLADIPALAGLAAVADVAVGGVTLDSRSVQPGDLYAALPGANTHGARFVADAVAAGAAAILTDQDGEQFIGEPVVPVAVVADPRGVLGEVAAQIYGNPARDLTMIGITGTNGKTTMTYLLAAGLAAAGPVGIIGTTGVRIGDEVLPSARTTPEAPDVHALLAVMRERGVRTVAMEVSSHALALGRVDGVVFDVAAFTNLSQDHLDFHGSMTDYFQAKADLFTPARSRRAVICIDDDWGRQLLAMTAIPADSYATTRAADWGLIDVEQSVTGGWQAAAVGPDSLQVPLSSRLPGRFNQANALGALAVLAAAGLDPAVAAAGIAACPGVPGRMEAVASPDFGAYVDYAHTPDAVARAIAAARGFSTGRILVALGCGGDRDAGKRAEMGKVAAVAADVLIVTDDNPRSEDPAAIRAAVMTGARESGGQAEVTEIGDRATAITELVARAQPGDAILLLGKGHETGQQIGDRIIPFDDREQLAAALARTGSDA
jgi:UDP-N-acetylmuramoyl-L-alanyl-D-glutamate--2,6-diaminopimelate ligase